MRRRRTFFAVLAAGLLFLSACSSGSTTDEGNEDGGEDTSGGGSVTVAAVWTGAEQESFEAVLDAFAEETGIEATYSPTGDDVGAFLGSQIEGGSPPDVAMLPQPGLLRDLAGRGALQPAGEDAVANLDANYADVWKDLGSVDGTLYGVYFKAANKSTWWYNTGVFETAGVEAPADWDAMLEAAGTVAASGTPWVSLGGADGWTLTDWFENLYVRVAGSDKYDQLSKHEIPWTDDSVVETLTAMAELFGNKALVGDSSNALQTDFPTSVSKVFSADAKSAIVYEGSFVAGVIGDASDFTVGDDAKWFPFPAVGDSPDSVIGGGDVAVAFGDNEASKAFLAYLATPEAAAKMVSTGSFTSANKNLDSGAYPDDNSKAVGQAIVDAGDNFRFDMSDLAPAAFGATVGSGEWKILQDFLKDPSDPTGTADSLEQAAVKAYK